MGPLEEIVVSVGSCSRGAGSIVKQQPRCGCRGGPVGSQWEWRFGPCGSCRGVPAQVPEPVVRRLAGHSERVTDLGPGCFPVQGASDGLFEVRFGGGELGDGFGDCAKGFEAESFGSFHGVSLD